jgi:hypothetical protein
MKHSLTRLAVALTALYWISGIVLAMTSAALEPPSGWLVFTWYQLAEILLLYYVVPLTALLWIGWAIFWLCGGTTWTTLFTVFGLALPLLYYAALQVPNLIERGWHAHQLALARIETIADEPLLTEQGHPIGVRLTYRVSFPAGLSALNQEPPADAPAADLYLPFPHSPLLDFAIRGSTLGQVARSGFSRGVSSVAVDFVPSFLPLTFQLPQAFPVSDPRNRCFRWKSVQERQQTLDAGAQRLSVEIGPYGRYLPRGSRTTEHAYILSDFYEGARREGAMECP